MVSSELKKALNWTEHRPYPLPEGAWILRMRCLELLFMHWRMPEASLQLLVPSALKLDTFDGSAWLGITPFRMQRTRTGFLPTVPWLSRFPELNVRAYVTTEGRPDIWFLSLDASNPVVVRIARATFSLPYVDAEMSSRVSGGQIRYKSVRIYKGTSPARLALSYHPVGESFRPRPGLLEYFLTERYCLYNADAQGRRVWRGDIHHLPWPLQEAETELEEFEMTAQIGVTLSDVEPLLHYARCLDVAAWLPKRINA